MELECICTWEQEALEKKLQVILAIIAATGALLGSTNQIIDTIFPPEFVPSKPEIVGSFEEETFNHEMRPNTIKFFLNHNMTENVPIERLMIGTKLFEPIECVPKPDDSQEFAKLDAWMNPEPSGQFDVLEIMPVGENGSRVDNIITINGKTAQFIASAHEEIVIDYVIVDALGNPDPQGYEFWMNYQVWCADSISCEDDREWTESGSYQFHAHTIPSPEFCIEEDD